MAEDNKEMISREFNSETSGVFRGSISLKVKTTFELSDDMQKFLTCPVCRNYFNDPVTMLSGNTVCQSCLPQGSPPGHINWRIRNILGLYKGLKAFLKQPPLVPNGWCPKHEEPFTFLCQEDNQTICQVCKYSSLHKGHILIDLGDKESSFL